MSQRGGNGDGDGGTGGKRERDGLRKGAGGLVEKGRAARCRFDGSARHVDPAAHRRRLRPRPPSVALSRLALCSVCYDIRVDSQYTLVYKKRCETVQK